MSALRLALPIVALALALPAAAQAVPPAVLTALECVDDNDTGPEACAASTDGLSGVEEAVVSPDGRDVYAVSDSDDAVVQLRRASDGSLTPAGCIDDNDPPDGPDACAQSADGLGGAEDVVVTPDGKNVLVVSDAEDALVNFARDPVTGVLTPAGCVEDNDPPEGPDGCTQSTNGLDGAFAAAVSPDGRDVYVVAVSDDAVVQIRRNTSTGALTPGACVDDNDPPAGADTCGLTTDGLNQPNDITVSPDGISVYAASNDDDAIVTFTRNTTTGTLSLPSCIDDNDAGQGADTCGGTADAVNEAENPVVSPDGRNVYLVSFPDQAVSVFDRAAGGSLTPAGCFHNTTGGDASCTQTAFGLNAAQGLAIAPDGTALYAVGANQRSVVSFRRGPDGALTPAGCIQDAPNVGCARQTPGLNIVRNVAVSPDGRDVYAPADADGAIVHLIGERAPVCVGGASGGAPDVLQTVPLDCSDPNADPTNIEILDAPGSGTLGAVDQANRTVAYTPNNGFSGLDGFSFRATADGAVSNTASAAVLVQAATGPAGPPGPVSIKLLALLGQDVVKARSGQKLSLRVAVTAPGAATLEILKGSQVVSTTKKTLGEGHGTIKWNGKGKAAKGKKAGPLKAGKYNLRLTVVGEDGQEATDSARLKLSRG